MPSTGILEQIYQLDKSSDDFADQLNNLLHDQEYIQCTENLNGEDARPFVDYLDEVLRPGVLKTPHRVARKCLRELKTICGAKARLPTSFVLPVEELQVGSMPHYNGGSADVYKGTFRASNVCVKNLRLSSQDDQGAVLQAFCKEAAMWKYLEHQNILPLLGVTLSPPQLISNWMPGGDLPEYIRTKPEANRLGFIRDVARGLDYLHSREVVHGDLKGINILVDISGNTPCAVIADFGVAFVTKNIESERPASYQGQQSPRWCAPEVMRGANPGTESDIFSFAMVVIEIFTGDVPFGESMSGFVAVEKVLGGDRPPKPQHQGCTEELWSLIQRCWNQDAEARPKVSKVLHTLDPASVPMN